MTTCTFDTWGELYVLHFSRRIGNYANPRGMAGHYFGWALDARRRIEQHLTESDVKIVRAALAQGVTLTGHVLGTAQKGMEWRIKRRKENYACYCPDCCRARRRPVKALPSGIQLELPLDWCDDPAFDFGDVPGVVWDGPEWDGYRVWWERTRVRTVDIGGHLDDLL